ncbi:SKP1-interacting partner 15-like protein [Trifolium pratense]|uniref:SKP1-interacting partner 15-like protein n=1 Tax=Trifolium pratense TaxID=57577 RepID=A0A2K3N146_TRIPR|nr:SKP1-interacting partner 15-like protein [Trifolium pratense]
MEQEEPLIYNLPQDTLHQIFSSLPLRQIIICRSLSKFFNNLLTSPTFLHHISTTLPPLNLLALRHHHYNHHNNHHIHLFDPNLNNWLHFPLNFLPFSSPLPVASSHGLIYLWAQPNNNNTQAQAQTQTQTLNTKSLLACNPLTRKFRILPHLGSAWCRHGSVLVDSVNRVMVLTELAALYYDDNNNKSWQKFSSNLPSKPRSPVLIEDSAFALCDVGSPWRSQWKLFSCRVGSTMSMIWSRLERQEWGDVFDILKRPRLVRGVGNRILMIGGLKSSFSLNSPCSTILILRLDLGTMEWDEAGRMPVEMFRCFQDAGKFKVFGAGDRVCFSAKRIGKLALWDRGAEMGDEWRWIDNVPGNGDGLYRGFVFEGRLDALP